MEPIKSMTDQLDAQQFFPSKKIYGIAGMAVVIQSGVASLRHMSILAWNITSQCGNTGKVEIKAGNTVLVTAKKDNHYLQMLQQGSAIISSSNVTVTVTVNEATVELKNSKASFTIMDNAGKKVGHVCDICIEDSTDDDYNDFYINLVGWKSVG